MLKLHFAGVIPKAGSAFDECADALAFNLNAARFAVADGVTISTFPEYWSRLLVDRFCANDDSEESLLVRHQWKEWLEPMQTQWFNDISALLPYLPRHSQLRTRNNLNASYGSAATFLGVKFRLTQTNRIQWRGVACGDTCLFHVVSGKLREVYPVSNPQTFNNHPANFPSFPTMPMARPRWLSGSARNGSLFFLVTDALAKWLLLHYQPNAEKTVFDRIAQVDTETAFRSFIEKARMSESVPLEDDDTTLMTIEVKRMPTTKLKTDVT